ncbi:MAG: putative protein YciO [Myxococcota bacterium]|nr:putative protein YciO [Myxococcota bacterium]
MLIQIHTHYPQERKIRHVVDILREGGVIAFPTDTCYGLGCSLHHREAIERIYMIKQMDTKKPLSLICRDIAEISQYAIVSDAAFRLIKRILPGPYTLIFQATREVPKRMLDPKRHTVGVRVPDAPICTEIVKELGHPLLTTSATFPGEEYMEYPEEIHMRYSKSIEAVIDVGPVPMDVSSIVSLTSDVPEIIREGKGDIAPILGARP